MNSSTESLRPAALTLVPNAFTAKATASFRSRSSCFSIRIRNTPSAARRSAYGSLLPVGSMPIPKIPTRVSSLSAMATAAPVRVLGSSAPAPRGMYCSFSASATSSGSPSLRA
ncbi:hypothetical protein D3C78_1407820 [compost metagenome]